MIYFLTAVIVILLLVLALVYRRTSKLLASLEDMMESAIKRQFFGKRVQRKTAI